MNKTIFTLVLIAVFASVSFADIPNTLNYQGRLMDQSGQPVTEGQYTVTFRLYAAASGGTMVWEEGQPVATNNGYFNTVLGNTTVLTPSMFSQPLWAGMQVAANAEMTPRQKLSTSAYAMTVADAGITTKKIAVKAVTNYWQHSIRALSNITNNENTWKNIESFQISPGGGALLVFCNLTFTVEDNIAMGLFRININDQFYAPFEEGYKYYQVTVSEHHTIGFSHVVTGVPEGIYNCSLQWKRLVGQIGKLRINSNDSLTISILELKR